MRPDAERGPEGPRSDPAAGKQEDHLQDTAEGPTRTPDLPVPTVHPDEVEAGWELVVEEDDDGNPLRAVDLRALTWRDRFHPEIRDTIRWAIVVELDAIGDIAAEAVRTQFVSDGRTIEEQMAALGPDVATMVAHVTRLHRLLGDGAL